MDINFDLLYQYSNQNPYAEEYFSYAGKKPWVKHYKHQLNSLFYLGFRHAADIKNPQLPTLRSEFEIFSQSSNKKIAFIEARIQMKSESSFKSEYDAIRMFESGLVHYMCTKKGIECICLQPDYVKEIINLQDHGVSSEEIILYIFGRGCWNKKTKEEIIQHLLIVYNKTKILIKNLFLEKRFNSIEEVFSFCYQKVVGEELRYSPDQIANLGNIVTPNTSNKTATLASQFTECNILNKIKQYILDGYDIFCVYGAGHLLRQEKVLDDMFKVNTI